MSEPMYLRMFYTKMHSMFQTKPSQATNGQIVRLLYSEKSGVLTVHLLNMDPYNMIALKPQPARVIEEDYIMQPLFLYRGLEKMRETRQLDEIQINNGLLMR